MTPEVGLGYVSQTSANGEDGHCQFLDNPAHTQVYYMAEQCPRIDRLEDMTTTASILIASTVDLLYALCPSLPRHETRHVTYY